MESLHFPPEVVVDDDPIDEAAMDDNDAHPPVDSIENLEDQIEDTTFENQYAWALARLRIAQANVLDPQQIAQAVQATRNRSLSSLEALVNQQRPPSRAPRPRDAAQQAAAMTRVAARFAAVGL
jgi:hypothetical protein